MALDENASKPLLGPNEPSAVEVVRPDAPSDLFLTCEHAGRRIPQRLGTLGVSESDLERHIAWDIGAEGVSRRLSEYLNATLVLQNYSRLVVDCNRSPDAEDFVVKLSENIEIPGNLDVTEADITARKHEVFDPYHEAVRNALDARERAGRATVLAAMHSCTPVFHGVSRPWHIGVLYDKDDRFARILLELLAEDGELVIGENEPYELSHERDYAVPVHAERRGLPHVEFEIRQDLIGTTEGQDEWAQRLAHVLQQGLVRLRKDRSRETCSKSTVS